jgi:hypothetical protein
LGHIFHLSHVPTFKANPSKVHRRPEHAVHVGNAGNVEMAERLIEIEGVLEHLLHVGGARRVPVRKGLVEGVPRLKDALEAHQAIDAPVPYHRAVHDPGRRRRERLRRGRGGVVGDGIPQQGGLVELEAPVRLRRNHCRPAESKDGHQKSHDHRRQPQLQSTRKDHSLGRNVCDESALAFVLRERCLTVKR